ncbi:MAG: hypothetical protein ACREMC_04210 [Gemmatimonadales bacterium]
MWRILGLVGVAGLSVVSACGVRLERATPAPGFRVTAKPGAGDTAVLRYVQSLDFNTRPGAGDDQLLHVGTCPGPTCGHGPRARIQPEKGAHRLTRAELAAGRVIARLVNEDRMDYPKFGLRAHSTVHWWVDSTGAGWRSVFFSTAPGAAPLVSDVVVETYHAYRWYEAIARWLWDPADELAWGTCEISGCCSSTGRAAM